MHECLNDPILNITLTQYSVNKGLKVFGKVGADAMVKELQQLHDRGVMKMMAANNLTEQEHRNALQYLMFLKQKQCGQIKGRGCANGRKQHSWLGNKDTSSPTVMTESVMLSCMINVKERQDVATADIPGAFMQTDLEEKVHIQLEGAMAELLLKIDPNLYNKYLI